MIIKKIKVSGFENIFDGIKESYTNGRNGFGDGLYTYLNHSMVSVELEDLTSIELFYLKKFATNVKIIDKVYNNFVNQDIDFDLHQKIEGLLMIHNNIIHDDDINKNESSPDTILPIGCIHYKVIAIFKGSGIVSLTGTMVQNIFKDKETGKLQEVYIGNPLMEQNMFQIFYNNFYSYMASQMSKLDLVTEFMTAKKFYNVDDSISSCAEIFSNHGEITLYNNTSNRLNYQIERIKENILISPTIHNDMIYFTFVLNTTFNTFMKWYMNTNYVIDHENLKIIFVNEGITISDEINKKYHHQIINSLNYLISHKKSLAKQTEYNLSKFNYIFEGTSIKYSIQFSLEDFLTDKLFTSKDFFVESENKMIFDNLTSVVNMIRPIFN